MMRNAVTLMCLVTAVFLGFSLASAGGSSSGQGDGLLPVDTLQVNYESGQGYEGPPEFRAGEVIVGFDPNSLPAERQRVVQEHGCWIARTCDLADFHLVGVPASTGPLDMVDQNSDGYPDGILQQTFKSDPNDFAYWFFQGTSMATPHVSGLAALLASHGVMAPDKIREAMEQTARDLGPPDWDPQYGWGLIDAHAALVYRVPAAR